MQTTTFTIIALTAISASVGVGFLFGYMVKSSTDYGSSIPPDVIKAVCTFSETALITGTVTIVENKNGGVFISGKLNGTEGRHGFHIHKLGDLGDNCRSANSHFNPHNMEHGGPTDTIRHVGDLGNLDFAGFVSTFNVTDQHVTLRGKDSVVGRSFVVHEKQDDEGKGSSVESKSTGAAGQRMACCVIGIAETSN
jgi:Cu-Zn family superoxide dismutase